MRRRSLLTVAFAGLVTAGCPSGGGIMNPPTENDLAMAQQPLPDLTMSNLPPGPDLTMPMTTTIDINLGARTKVDILFMVDNSNSMSAMSDQLKARFDQFFKVFQDLATGMTFADLNIGVVTSDYGAGKTGAPGCQPSPGGQQGHLQALGVAAAAGCLPPTGGQPFIHFDFNPAHAGGSNLPAGQNLVQTFSCMASVGSMGCGFEHQLESVYAALHNNPPANAGFLRDDALLAIVFLTNEDDSSAPPDSDMFDKSAVAMWGYESSYRQTRWGIQCDYAGMTAALPPYGDSGGPMSNCVPATNPPGAEFDVSRYVQYFTLPKNQGGVKTDPRDVILFGIDAPGPQENASVQIILANPSAPGGQPYTPCSPLNESTNPPCVPVLQHSCQNPQQPVFFGDPAVRLNSVIRQAKGGFAISSICNSDYTGALQSLGNLVVSGLGGNCITGKLANPTSPDCIVSDTVTSGGSTTTVSIPACSQSAGTKPCWSAVASSSCACGSGGCTSSQSPDGLGIVIDRGGSPPPAGSTTMATCHVI